MKQNLVIEVDGMELALQIIEGLTGTVRPDGLTAKQAFDSIDDEDLKHGAIRAAQKASIYMTQRMEKAKRIQ